MPTEQSDNTRVEQPIKLLLPSPEVIELLTRLRLLKEMLPDLLYDTLKSKLYENMLNAINTHALFGYGLTGRQINYNPNTSQGLAAIQSNFDYTKSNALNFAELLALAGAAESVGLAIRYATVPIKVGEGAENSVEAVRAALKVKKTGTVPRSDAHAMKNVPRMAQLNFKGKSPEGLNIYTQMKVKPATTPKQILEATEEVGKAMKKKGCKEITHPNLQGKAYIKDGNVYSDLQYGKRNGKWWIYDLIRERMSEPLFMLSLLRKGGTLINTN